MELFEVKVSERGNWLFVRLRTSLIRVGQAPRDADASTQAMLGKFFALVWHSEVFNFGTCLE